jgi:hypothetical protein
MRQICNRVSLRPYYYPALAIAIKQAYRIEAEKRAKASLFKSAAVYALDPVQKHFPALIYNLA